MSTVNLQVDCPPTHKGSPVTWCGEAPGEDEMWRKEGFVGKAGQMLETICHLGGLDLRRCNLTNVVKRRPPANNFKSAFYETTKVGKKKVMRATDELAAWVDNLAAELREHRPNVVVACGNEALKALVGLENITKRQGSVYESTLVPGLKVVAMLHPSSILKTKAWQSIYVCARIVEKIVVPEAAHAHIQEHDWEEIHEPDIETVERIFHRWGESGTRWVIDIETRGGGISCVGVGFATRGGGLGGELCVVVPIETTTGPYYSLEDEARFWVLLQQLSDRNPNLILQNSQYDIEWMMDYGFIPSSVLLDTMTLHHLMYAELPKKLEFINFFYPTGVPYYKDEGKTWGKKEPDKATWAYCAKDLVSELRVSFSVEHEAREAGVWDMYQREYMPLLPVALEMQRRGFAVDDESLKSLQQWVGVEWDTAHGDLVKLAGWEVNISSPKQVPKLLYQQLGFPKLYGKSNADEDALVVLKSWLEGQKPKAHTAKCKWGEKACQHRNGDRLDTMRQVLECVMKCRKLAKAKSSYLADRLFVEVA